MAHGPLPDGYVLTNVCGSISCVKPTHWELRADMIVKPSLPATHCKKGHPLVVGNIYRYPKSGARRCCVCSGRRPNVTR